MTKGERVHKDSKIGGEKYDKERGTIKIFEHTSRGEQAHELVCCI